MVDLDVLTGGDVALVQGRVLLHHGGEHVHLVGGDPAHRQLDAAHLDVGLALAVDALLEPEADELGLLGPAVEELLRLVVEVVELVLEDRYHVPGHVGEDLGVVQRPLTAAGRAGRRLHPAKLANPLGDSGLSPFW